MIVETERDYHMRRARAELDLAYRSECRTAMESHLRLSSLHMQRLRSAESAARPAGPRFFLRTAAGIISLRPPETNIEARGVAAVSG